MCENPCSTEQADSCQLMKVKGMVRQGRKGTHRWDGHQGEKEDITRERKIQNYKIRNKNLLNNKKLIPCTLFSLG